MARDKDAKADGGDKKLDTDELTQIGNKRQQKADIEVFTDHARITIEGAAKVAAERGEKELKDFMVDGRFPADFNVDDRAKVIAKLIKFLPAGAAIVVVEDYLMVSFSWP